LAQPTHSLLTPTLWISSTLYYSRQVSVSFLREYPSQANACFKSFASPSFSNSELSARQFSYNCLVSLGFPQRVSLISPRQIIVSYLLVLPDKYQTTLCNDCILSLNLPDNITQLSLFCFHYFVPPDISQPYNYILWIYYFIARDIFQSNVISSNKLRPLPTNDFRSQ